MNRDEYWDLFRGTGDIFAYLKYKNEDLILLNSGKSPSHSFGGKYSNNSERQEGGMSYGTISKFDGHGSGGSANW